MDTRRDSYERAHAEKIISKRQMQVVNYFLDHPEHLITQGDVGRHYADLCGSCSARFSELERAEIIECVGTAYDSITKRNVQAYRLTGYVPLVKLKPVRKTVCCPQCQTVFTPKR